MINHENHTALKFESSEKQKKSLDSEDASLFVLAKYSLKQQINYPHFLKRHCPTIGSTEYILPPSSPGLVKGQQMAELFHP